jgi:hypothetical protein
MLSSTVLDGLICAVGHAVAQSVEALSYKPEGRRFEIPDGVTGIFH